MNLHDITPDFITFNAKVEGKSDETKLRRFWSDLHPANPAFYDQRLAQWERFGEDPEAELRRSRRSRLTELPLPICSALLELYYGWSRAVLEAQIDWLRERQGAL